MNKLLVVCGPTATGKTDIGIFLAKKFNGEIISADSRQVYKGMDIGTGKDIPENFKYQISNIKFKETVAGFFTDGEIKIWGLDLVDPSYPFNLGEYKKIALAVIANIQKRSKLPIIVGGTGLYIKALTTKLADTSIPRNIQLRLELEKLNVEELQKKLRNIDSNRFSRMNQSDQNNPRRLIRAIEIETWKRSNNAPHPPLNLRGGEGELYADIFCVGLNAPQTVLFTRIDKRIHERMRQGLLKEIQSLLNKGYSWQLQSFSATGYQEWQDYFDGKRTQAKVIALWQKHEEQYAKRQLTWFKKDSRIRWFDISTKGFKNEVERQVCAWYTV